MTNANNRLMWHGMFLFLIGLLTGFAEGRFANIRMGLAAHLEGVMNGIFLLALGSAWTLVRLQRPLENIAYCSVLYAAYGNWLFTTFAAAFGTAALSPIIGAGHAGQRWQENLVTGGFLTVGLAYVLSSAILLWGLRARTST